MHITQLSDADFSQWLPLWQANMEHSISAEITEETWRRICNPSFPIGGLGARMEEGGPLAGICHFILHPTTGSLKQVCYMQDLYIDPTFRRKGIAQTLVTYLAAMGTAHHWGRIYWLAEARNEAAQNLYQSLGLKLDFTLHVLPLN